MDGRMDGGGGGYGPVAWKRLSRCMSGRLDGMGEIEQMCERMDGWMGVMGPCWTGRWPACWCYVEED